MTLQPSKRYVIAWRTIDGAEGRGDAKHTIEEAELYCIQLNNEYHHMFHFPLEVLTDASENKQDITVH